MKFLALLFRTPVREEIACLEGAQGRARGIKLEKEIARAALGCYPGV